ncbi:Trna pseudouridine synthase A-like protein [Leptomonas seymouri]|uniref:Trna pseudouridine synthase A-like protein n=1 Tax=Leptomonas seymouri TaxID=5684 RepID=A0A0N1I702_LEPSE|nr:Trna pseudouridine synthase A-like protein [Leptomonas seymouri]|eukprot:KPI89150.1 Trna pseudouridine synthase A-like protein [Leptomonas seymouri]
MLLRRRWGRSGSGSLCGLHIVLRHSSTSSNNNNKGGGTDRNGEEHASQLSPSTRNRTFPPNDESRATADAPSGSFSAPAPSGFQGWKRFDLPRDGNTTNAAASPIKTLPPFDASLPGTASAHSVVDQKREHDEARRRAASARLADMFVESERHVQWMQEQRQQPAQSQHYQEELSSVRHAVQQQSTAAVTRSNVQNYSYDEDADDALPPESATSALARTPPAEILEQELLDDNFLYYPPPVPLHADVAIGSTSDPPHPAPEKVGYVPGQQIVPPGLTRYRVDVQYQGSDFDGWYKSVRRTRPPMKSEGGGTSAIAEGGSRHYARTVLEEALAVALDVASLTVVAAAIPETGVSVRRLTCHVDVPSEVELQPRTILQRAALWLHQRHQPLAILSCYPCKNQDFHARHSGVRRVYCYRILNRIAPPLFDAGLQWHVDRYLDVARMQRMAKAMEGTRDYGYFADPKMANALRRAAAHTGGGGGQVVSSAYSPEHEPLLSHGLPRGQMPAAPKKSIDRGLSQLERAAVLPTFNEYGQRVVTYQAKPREYHKARTNLPTVRTIDKIDVVRQEDEVLIWFVGQSFLRCQIRNMVSVLKASGHGLWDDQELQHAFQSGFEVSRKKFARERLPPAPVHGLTLWDVEYPAQHMSDFVSYVDAGPYEPHDISVQH